MSRGAKRRSDTLRMFAPAGTSAPAERASGVRPRGRTTVLRREDFVQEAARAVRRAADSSLPPPPQPLVDALDAFDDAVRTYGAPRGPADLVAEVTEELGEEGWWTVRWDARRAPNGLGFHVRWARDRQGPSREAAAPTFDDGLRAILRAERGG